MINILDLTTASQGIGTGDMSKAIYDANNNLVVDLAENSRKVNGLTVETAVPTGAVFTDTIYDDARLQLEGMFDKTRPISFVFMSYSSGDISKIEVYKDELKTVHLFTKEIGYTNGNITSVLIKNEQTADTLLKNIEYDTSGNIRKISIVM